MNTELEALREEINNLDKELLEILEERLCLCEEIAVIKTHTSVSPEGQKEQRDRREEAQIIQSAINSTSLDKKFVKNIFALILAESKSLQEKIVNE